MKIKLIETFGNYWDYYANEWIYTEEQYSYVFKYLDFDKLEKKYGIYFNNKEMKKMFHKTYTNENILSCIYLKSPLGYEWLKSNWGQGVFETPIYYSDKQELKTIVNKVINVTLIRGNNEN